MLYKKPSSSSQQSRNSKRSYKKEAPSEVFEARNVTKTFDAISSLLREIHSKSLDYLRRIDHPTRRVFKVTQALWALANSSVEDSRVQPWRVIKQILTKETLHSILAIDHSKVDPSLIRTLFEEFIHDRSWDICKISKESQTIGIMAQWLSVLCVLVCLR